MQTEPKPSKTRQSPAARRFGYVVAAAVNGALLYVVNNLLAWDVLPFLTDDFDRVVPIVSFSLGAAIVVNLAYVIYDSGWFKSLSQIGLAGISMAATVRMYQVFPFDYSAYEFDWATLTRVVLILAMVGIAISIVVEVVKLATGRTR